MTGGPDLPVPGAGAGTAANRGRLEALTALRFVAAAMIVFHHSREQFPVLSGIGTGVVLDQAVSFFFVLSGFILNFVYPNLDEPGAIRRFFVARFARIWPAHAAAFLLFCVVQLPPPSWIALPNLAMVHAWIPLSAVFFSFNAPSWSISAEFGFYLLFPFLVRKFDSRWPSRLAMAFLCVALLAGFANWFDLPLYGRAGSGISSTALVYVSPLGRLFEFVLGMCTATAFRRARGRLSLSRASGTALELAALVAAATAVATSNRVAFAARWAGAAGREWLAHGGASCLVFAALVFVMALQAGRVSALLSRRGPVLLGEISYSVYLFHTLVRTVYLRATEGIDAPDLLLLAGYWAAVLMTSHLVWAAVERPARAALVRVLSPARPSGATAQGAAWRDLRAGSRLFLGAEAALVLGALFGLPMVARSPATRSPELSLLDLLPRAGIEARESRFVMRTRMPVGGEERDVCFMHPPSRVRFPAVVPDPSTSLSFGVGISDEASRENGDGARFEAFVASGGERVRIFAADLDPVHRASDRSWRDTRISLAAWAGKRVEIELSVSPGAAGNEDFDWAGWSGLELRDVR